MDDFFAPRAAESITDFESMPHSWSTTLEWQPVSNRYKVSAPFDIGPYLVGRVDPIVR